MDIALISEGVSEHVVIKHIIERYLKDLEPEVNQIQPQIINGRQSNPGGWNEVLKYCEREYDLQTILALNDYLVIQIDTDMSETSPYSIPQNDIGDEQLWGKVKDKLYGLIPDSIEIDKDKIIFAICIQSTECWLLPIYYNDSRKTKIDNCLESLNRELIRKDIGSIPQNDKNSANSQRIYQEILKKLKKAKDIKDCSEHNYGFKMFIEQLDNIPTEEN